MATEKDAREAQSCSTVVAVAKRLPEFTATVFPDSDTPLRLDTAAGIALVILLFASSVLVVFSGVSKIGYSVYEALVRLNTIWWQLLILGVAGALGLHAFDVYNWRPRVLRGLGVAVVMHVIMAAALSQTKRYPGAPLIVAFLYLPLLLCCFRYLTRRHLSSRGFYQGLVGCCAAVAMMTLIAWLIWVFNAEMTWGRETKDKLHSELSEIYELYKVDSWALCQQAKTKGGLSTKCKSLHLIAFLIWACPLIEFGVLLVVATLSLMRLLSLRPAGGDGSFESTWMKVIMLFFLILATGFWVGATTMGASMGLSNFYLASLCTAGCVFLIWLVASVDMKVFIEAASSSTFYKIGQPFFESDWFVALVLCLTFYIIVFFLALEVGVRHLQRLWNAPGEVPWITDRGLHVWNFLRKQHMPSCLEKVFQWCILYLVFYFFTKFTPVFLGWLNSELKSLSFAAVTVIFYHVGIFMFLLPPVPGVPVYMAAGVILVEQGRSSLGFVGAIAFACLVGLLLKLNAVVLQQKVIGEIFGRSLYIQQLVGVHTISIRAIEMILTRPGLSMRKVFILCGGPDWPTSVLTGILRLNLLQMLIGTLPCVLLIVPCVLAGASILEESMRSLSPMIIALVGVTQGGVLLMALMFIANEAQNSHAVLSEPKPEHKELLDKADIVKQQCKNYREKTSWPVLTFLQRLLLVSSASVELLCCVVCTFLDFACFRAFETGNSLDARFEDGGLQGNMLNVVKWPQGAFLCALFALGIALFIIYGQVTRLRISKQVADCC